MSINPLRLYIDPSWRVADLAHIPLLYPWWGEIVSKSSPYSEATNKYGFDPACFCLVSEPVQAEYFLLPYDYWQVKDRHPEVLSRCIDQSRVLGRPLLVDASGDRLGTVGVPGAVVLRINQYRFSRPSYEVTVPLPCEDLLESFCAGQLSTRTKSPVPSIGFVGWASLPRRQRWRTMIKELPLRIASLIQPKYQACQKGVFWRERALDVFSSSNQVVSKFIVRPSYSGHQATLVGDPRKNRQEFVNNILSTDYSLVVRGDANASARLYEVLSLGRIPVIIDTAAVYPLEGKIDYGSFSLMIDYRDLMSGPERLVEFHRAMTNDKFIAMQEVARSAFKNFFRYDAFSRHLVTELRARLLTL